MDILGIIGSPRKNGRTNTLVEATLEGAGSTGATTQLIYLADYEIRPFLGQGGSAEALQGCPEEVSTLCEQADAIVLGAPVYWGDINGLTKDFMDIVRISNANGKPALGIAIAGGTGKGLLSGTQSIYHFFYHRQMRGVDPTPVSRFNFDKALAELHNSGIRLTELASQPSPFPGTDREGRWPEVLAHYATLRYLGADPVDEFVMLAEQLIDISSVSNVAEAQRELDQALDLIARGRRGEAARHAVQSYQILYFPSE